MSFWVSGAIIAAAALTAGSTVYSANKQSKATKRASNLQKQASDNALRQQTQEMNQNNQRTADTESIIENSTGSDVQSTMLTGPSGLSIDDLILGRGTSQLGGRM